VGWGRAPERRRELLRRNSLATGFSSRKYRCSLCSFRYPRRRRGSRLAAEAAHGQPFRLPMLTPGGGHLTKVPGSKATRGERMQNGARVSSDLNDVDLDVYGW